MDLVKKSTNSRGNDWADIFHSLQIFLICGHSLEAIPAERVWQVHLAGHSDRGTHLLDTHGGPVCDAVWDLYRLATQRIGAVASLVEWDENVPDWETLVGENERARTIRRQALEA